MGFWNAAGLLGGAAGLGAQQQSQAGNAQAQLSNSVANQQSQYMRGLQQHLGQYQQALTENIFYDKKTNTIIRGDEAIENYFKAKFFKKDLEDIINED